METTANNFQQECDSLTQLYKDEDSNVSIHPKMQDFEPQVYITFEISGGPRDKVGALNLVGDKAESCLRSRENILCNSGQGNLFHES